MVILKCFSDILEIVKCDISLKVLSYGEDENGGLAMFYVKAFQNGALDPLLFFINSNSAVEG